MSTDNLDNKLLNQYKKQVAESKPTCPNCGYCPTCGRQRYAGPWLPYPYWGWTNPNWVVTTSPTVTMATATNATSTNFTLTC